MIFLILQDPQFRAKGLFRSWLRFGRWFDGGQGTLPTLRLQLFSLNLHVKAQLQLPLSWFIGTHGFVVLVMEWVCVCVCVILSMQTSLEDQTKPRNQPTKLFG